MWEAKFSDVSLEKIKIDRKKFLEVLKAIELQLTIDLEKTYLRIRSEKERDDLKYNLEDIKRIATDLQDVEEAIEVLKIEGVMI